MDLRRHQQPITYLTGPWDDFMVHGVNNPWDTCMSIKVEFLFSFFFPRASLVDDSDKSGPHVAPFVSGLQHRTLLQENGGATFRSLINYKQPFLSLFFPGIIMIRSPKHSTSNMIYEWGEPTASYTWTSWVWDFYKIFFTFNINVKNIS